MGSRRMVAMVCAVIAAFLVAAAGRSCAKDIDAKNKANRKSSSGQTADFDIVYPNSPQGNGQEGTKDPAESGQQYDEFGRPIKKEDNIIIIEPTDENGNPVEESGNDGEKPEAPEAPEVQEVTDAFGFVVATEYAGGGGAETDDNGFGSFGNEPPPAISGFNHGQWDEDGNLLPTLPPGFSIEVG